jgi:hypothetical protein
LKIAMHAELRDESGHHAEEAAFIEIAFAHQLAEAIQTARNLCTKIDKFYVL